MATPAHQLLMVNACIYIQITRMDFNLIEIPLKCTTLNTPVSYVDENYADVNVTSFQNLKHS